MCALVDIISFHRIFCNIKAKTNDFRPKNLILSFATVT